MKDKDTIIISVLGTAGSGRTTVIMLLANALKAHNIEYNIESLDIPPTVENTKQLTMRAEAVATKAKIKVLIKDQQAQRDSFKTNQDALGITK